MKRFLLLLLTLLPCIALAETTLPAKPSGRVSDSGMIFDSAVATEMSKNLQRLYTRNRIAGYVVAMEQVDKKEEAGMPDKLRDAWITDNVGFIILYARNTDQILVSLTPKAYSIAQATGPIEDLAKKIDESNLDGPSRGMPKVLNLLSDQLNVKPPAQVIVVQEKEVPAFLILLPIGIVLLLLGWGLFFGYRRLASQNLFQTLYRFQAEVVSPKLGSTIGGINTAVKKF